jgi:hypothetical protein
MKSNIYAALLIILLIVIYPFVSGIQDDKSRDMTTFVPDSALAYFEQHHGSLALKEFRESPLGKNFEAIDFLKTGKKIGLTESLLSDVEEILSFYTSAKNNTLLHEILGEMFAVALLSPIDAKKYNDTKGYLQDNA